METRFTLNEYAAPITANQPYTMAQMTAVLKEYIKEHYPGVYSFSLIGHPETISRILPDLVFRVTEDGKIKTSLLTFANDGGVEITVRIVSYINFKIGNLHLEPLKNGRLYDYEPFVPSSNNESTTIVKSINPTAKEEFAGMIKATIIGNGLALEDVDMVMIVGPQAELAKVFPSAEFTSVDGLAYKFAITNIEGIRTQCIVSEDDKPVRIVISKRQNV